MINLKVLKPWLIIGSLILIYLNYNLFAAVASGASQTDTMITAITMSLLPAAALILSLLLLRGDNQMFRVGVGLMAMSFAIAFMADPYSVSLRMDLGLNLMQLIIYNAIGTVFLIIAVYAFKQS